MATTQTVAMCGRCQQAPQMGGTGATRALCPGCAQSFADLFAGLPECQPVEECEACGAPMVTSDDVTSGNSWPYCSAGCSSCP